MAPCSHNSPHCTCMRRTEPNVRSMGPGPRYFARLRLAEAALEEYADAFEVNPRSRLYELLEEWRKAKNASEEGQ